MARRDSFSHSLLRFKEGYSPDLAAWIDCSLEALAREPFPPQTLLVRALHHHETSAPPPHPTSLDLLGQALASRLQTRYQPSLICKYHTTRPIKGFTRVGRAAELKDIYSVNDTGSDPHSILIFDDIYTTGATMRAILDALRPRFPDCRFSVFTLARAIFDASDSSDRPIRGRIFQLEKDMNWILADPPGATHGNFA